MSGDPSWPPVIEEFRGDRRSLTSLFELADDSEQAIEGYREEGVVLVARVDHVVVGLALIVVGLSGSKAELKSLAVELGWQGRGIGRRLVEAAADHARLTGSSLLEVATASADIGNLRFYQRSGFRMARIVRDGFTARSGYPAGQVSDGIPLRDQVIFDREL